MKPANREVNTAHILTLLVALFLAAFQGPVFAQCSTNAWSGVTGTPEALGTGTTQVGLTYEQDCGLTIDASSGPSFVTTTTPDNEPTAVVRFYLLPETLSIASGDVVVFSARDDATTEFEIHLRSSGGVNYLIAFYRDSGILTEHPETIPLHNVWQAIEMAWSTGAGDGIFALTLDGVLRYSKTDLINDSGVINEVDMGVINAADATGEVVFDAFDLRRSQSPGLLTVNELGNIATRAEVGTVHEIEIGGFIIEGDTDKCVVVRGRGPSMNLPAGVAKLLDPKLQLFSGGTPIASNDNWLDSPEADAILNLGLEPADDAEAAIFICLPPGPYTAWLTGVGDTEGVGIIEVLDADVGTSYLFNIATRAAVYTENLVTIAGFIIQGDQPKQVLIRGRGPSVGVPAGVTRLADPRLRLFDGVNVQFEDNDNWGDATNAAEIDGSGYAPPDASESAILITLDPGRYTAILDGIGDVTGVGIVEVFDLSGGAVAAQ